MFGQVIKRGKVPVSSIGVYINEFEDEVVESSATYEGPRSVFGQVINRGKVPVSSIGVHINEFENEVVESSASA